MRDASVRLVVGGVAVGDDKAATTPWPTTDATVTYGDLDDLWGTSLDVADVNASNFGVLIQCQEYSNSARVARIDAISITITYAPPVVVYLVAPEDLTATAISTSEIDLAWTDTNAYETGYEIERFTEGSIWALIYTAGADEESYHDSGLDSGTTYYYRVRAIGSVGPWSAVASATTAQNLESPTNCAVSVSGVDATITWEHSGTGIASFGLERSVDGVLWDLIALPAATDRSYVDTDLAQGLYYYRVRAFYDPGYSGYSNIASVMAVYTVMEQEGYRWRNADGSEITSTWKAPQDQYAVVKRGETVGLRFLVNVLAGEPDPRYFIVQYRELGSTEWLTLE